MKAYFSALVLCATLGASTIGHAQITHGDKNVPLKVADSTMSKRLTSDWNARNSALKDQSVDWFASNDGYFGTYSIDEKDYMARYDREGNFIETMNRKEWDEMIPTSLKSSFDKSIYKSQQVTSYWEVSDPYRKGYYMELMDKQDKITYVWADENGKFTTTPYTGKPNE